MKLVIAVIQPSRLEEVRSALGSIGLRGLMVTDIHGYGRQAGQTEIYRGAEYQVRFVAKSRIDVVVPDEALPAAVEAISDKAQTGTIGDGKIFVLDVEEAARVRTGESGAEAL